MKLFSVIGNPIAHSKSPEIHVAFAAQFDIAIDYRRLLAEVGKFNATALHFFERGSGANVTLPFKEDALNFADELSPVAQAAGAVNTLSRQGGIIKGDNTDGIGLVRDIQENYGVSLRDKSVLIVGAGGAARGVLLPIISEKPASLSLVNRTEAKAQALAEQFADQLPIAVETFATLSQPFDIVINATSASLSGNELPLPTEIFSVDTLAYDMMYGKYPTAFMQSAADCGATAVDGLGMLVEQAAKSFEIWHGVVPETPSVIKMLRQQLQSSDK